MAKIALLLFVVAIMVSLHAIEAHRKGQTDAALKKDLHKAEAMIEKDLKAKKKGIQGLTPEVKSLGKSEQMLKDLEKDHKKKMDLTAYEQQLKSFNRVTKINKGPARKRKPVSIIQSILSDFGLNRGRN